MPMQNKEIRNKQKEVFIKNYGVDNPFISNDFKEKYKNTSLKNYGVEHPSKSNEVKEQIKNTNLKNYGVTNSLQYKEIQDKCKKTILERYGVENISQNTEIKNKVIQTNIKNYGVSHPMKNIEIQEKQKKTNLERYGVEYILQLPEIQIQSEKFSKRYKNYKMPSGKIRKVQGYEPLALDELILFYNEEQIKTGRIDIPNIEYIINGKTKRYFPDIYIPHENKIIEVKSTYTYNNIGGYVQEKREATKSKGYNYEIWIYDKKKIKTIII